MFLTGGDEDDEEVDEETGQRSRIRHEAGL